MPWLRLIVAGSAGRLRRWIVVADSRRLITAGQTRRKPYMPRRAFIRLEISFAHVVHVSRGYRFAPCRSNLMYGLKRLPLISVSFSYDTHLPTYSNIQA